MSENRQKGTGMEKLFEICRLAQISTKDFRQNTVFVCRGDLRSPAGVRSTPLRISNESSVTQVSLYSSYMVRYFFVF